MLKLFSFLFSFTMLLPAVFGSKRPNTSNSSYLFSGSRDFYIKSKCFNRYFDIHLLGGSSLEFLSSTPIYLWPKRCGTMQRFRIIHFEREKYFIHPASSANMLITPNSEISGSTSRVSLQPRYNGKEQQWKLLSHKDGSWSFKNVKTKKCLEAINGGSLVHTCCSGSVSQCFFISPATDTNQ